MADRSTYVTIGARVDGFVAGLNKMKTETSKFSKGLSLEAAKNEKEFTQLGTALATIGTVGAVGLGLAISKFAEFDQSMSFVQAATHETATNMGLLRDAALEAGASTVFSATESANAIEELSKAGLSTSDILGGALKGSLDLAAAGGLGVARAAEIASTTLAQFNLEGDKAGHVADVLAAGAGKAMGSVDDLAQGLKFVGPLAQGMGISLEQTTGTLAAFAKAGIVGEQGGTALRGMLSSLTAPSKQARDEMERLNITLYDQAGNFLGIDNAAGELQRAYSDLKPEVRDASLGILFGNEQLSAARVLYAEGADGIREWTGAVDDAGYAAETAAIRLDNLSGDLEGLGGAMDTALIKTGAASDDVLRGLVQTGTNLIDIYNNGPESMQGMVLALGGIATAATIAGGAFFLGAPKVVAFNAALATMREESPKTVRAAGMIGKGVGALAALTVVTAVIDEVDASLQRMGATSEEIINSLKTGSVSDALSDAFSGDNITGSRIAAQADALKDLGKVLDDLGGSIDTRWAPGGIGESFIGWVDGIDEPTDAARDSLERLGSALATLPVNEAAVEMNDLIEKYDLTDKQVLQLIDSMPEYKNALVTQATQLGINADEQYLLNAATEEAAPVAKTAAEAYMDAAGEAEGLKDSLSALIDQINEANGVGQDAVSANLDYQDALAKVDETIQKARDGVEGYSLTLDTNTQQGRDNLGMLNDLAAQSQDAAKAQFALDGNTDNYRATLEKGRAALIKRAEDLGYNAEQAEALADQVYRIPTKREMEVIAHTADASRAIDNFVRLSSGKTIRIAVQATNTSPGSWTGGITQANGGLVDYYANGGLRERHIAQIAPAGAWRVWAEPETGGEAYIPLAPGKRARSLEIWAETGRRLQAFADGGFSRQPVYVPESRSFTMGATGSPQDVNVQVELIPSGGAEQFVDARIRVNGREQHMSVKAKLR